MATAVNIKSKSTRLAVITALKKIAQYLKLIKKFPVNGLAFFSYDTLEVIEPPNAIKHFIYLCDKVFHVDSLLELYEEHDYDGVVLVSGNNCYFYQIHIGVTLLYKMDVNLQSRQKKGGQSAVRIARLAEEKRHLFVKQIVEKMNQLYVGRVKNLVVAGPAEMKDLVCNCDLLDYRLRPIIMAKITLDTITDTSIHKVMELNLFSQQKMSEDAILCKKIIDEINMGNNRYVYGIEYITEYMEQNNCDTIYVDEQHAHVFTQNVKVIKSNQYSDLFEQYGGIVLYNYYAI